VAAVLDFTSALYLGLRHPSGSLRPWPALTSGKPGVLATPAGSREVARELARLQGCEGGTLAPSTLHLFWDLFGLLARERVSIYMDAGTYAIARWGAERAAAAGIPVRRFPHHDAEAADVLIARHADDGRRPVIVADGFCPICARPAPLSRYLQSVERRGGQLLIDDTQALGVLGKKPCAEAPFGQGGGGSLGRNSVCSPSVMTGSSLAKGFGVPIAALCGSAPTISFFEEQSETRVHASPPSVATLRAAEHALTVNRVQGGNRRLHLAELVARFRTQLRQIGVAAHGEAFPMQTLDLPDGVNANAIQRRLLLRGIRTVVVRGCRNMGVRLGFLITAWHRSADIDHAIEALESVMAGDGMHAASARTS
jgi:8-amino-7-oxononanoate synthase